ncbi:MAG: surface lipoprotein assembly modifier [Betaproteobacteria bacterium]
MRFARCLLIVLAALAPQVAFAMSERDLQATFMRAAHMLERGEYGEAISGFRTVLRHTDSPRVKLELARALYLQKEYEEAKTLFKEVLYSPDTPWRVQDNIETFIRAIEEAQGYAKISVSLVSDSNPRSLTAQREFTIAGAPVRFLPPPDSATAHGLRYAFQGYQPLSTEQRVAGYFTASYLDFASSSLDRLTLDGGLAKTFDQARRVTARLGLEAGTFGGRMLYHFPYASGLLVLSESPTRRLTGEAKLGKVRFPDFNYLDADYASGGLSAIQALEGGHALSLAGTAENSSARERPYSYYGLAITPGIAWMANAPALLFKTELSLSTRRYAEADPLFGERRSDRKARVDFSIRSKQWRWATWRPGVMLSLERNESTIEFYAYRKANVSFVLE